MFQFTEADMKLILIILLIPLIAISQSDYDMVIDNTASSDLSIDNTASADLEIHSTVVPKILDNLATFPDGAWSTYKQLTTTYTGDLITVRRDADDAELGVGFLSTGYIDLVTMAAWAGASNLYISKIYEQSGAVGADDFVQTTHARQPALTLTGHGLYPVATFAGSQYMDAGASLRTTTGAVSATMWAKETGGANQCFLITQRLNTDPGFRLISSGGTDLRLYMYDDEYDGSYTYKTTYPVGFQQFSFTWTGTGGSITLYGNGSATPLHATVLATTENVVSVYALRIGIRHTLDMGLNGKISTIIGWKAVSSNADRALIQTDINGDL